MGHSKLVGAVSNCAVSTYHGPYAVRLKTAPTGGESVHLFLESTIVRCRDSEIPPTGELNAPKFFNAYLANCLCIANSSDFVRNKIDKYPQLCYNATRGFD